MMCGLLKKSSIRDAERFPGAGEQAVALTIIPAISTSQEVPPMNAKHCFLGCGAACRKHCNNNSIDKNEDAIPFHIYISMEVEHNALRTGG